MKTVLQVPAYRGRVLSCEHADLASLLLYNGYEDIDVLFGMNYSFRYAAHHFDRLSNCVRIVREALGVELLSGEADDAEKAWDVSRQMLGAAQPVAVGVDVFYLDYHPSFRKTHSAHCSILRGLDEELAVAYVLDLGPLDPTDLSVIYDGTLPLPSLQSARSSENPRAPGTNSPYSGNPIRNGWFCLRCSKTRRAREWEVPLSILSGELTEMLSGRHDGRWHEWRAAIRAFAEDLVDAEPGRVPSWRPDLLVEAHSFLLQTADERELLRASLAKIYGSAGFRELHSVLEGLNRLAREWQLAGRLALKASIVGSDGRTSARLRERLLHLDVAEGDLVDRLHEFLSKQVGRT